ncbi:MAG: GTP cyclohydrolase I [Acidobacteriia bacterium]|nr:GTP cyclohydrolase I [Terriglobia bacterium]
MDRATMEDGIRRFLEGVGERFPGDDLEATPERVARAWADDLLSGYGEYPERELTWTPAPAGTGLVLVRNVRFASVCVHHLLPFVGVAHVAYLPDARLAGLSKLGRVVEVHARRLQIQERLTSAILATLGRVLEPKGAMVVLDAEHTCMTLRGVKKEGSRLITLAASGIYETDASARGDLLGLLAPANGGLTGPR